MSMYDPRTGYRMGPWEYDRHVRAQRMEQEINALKAKSSQLNVYYDAMGKAYLTQRMPILESEPTKPNNLLLLL
jgi:hypothetical protein